METLKELRKEKKMTQQAVADFVGISLRSYKTYENDASKVGSIKYKYIYELLREMNKIDETHGILELEEIMKICTEIFACYDINFCYLFGSYAKGKAGEKSDVDLLIDTSLSGLKYFALVEELRQKLKKQVDVLDFRQLEKNPELLREILKDGIKIYG